MTDPMLPALPGANPSHARAHNRRVVLDVVRLLGPLSRAEIARATTLTAQAVSNIAQELIGLGLLREAGRRRAALGQPPVDLAIAPAGAYAVGLHLDHHRVAGIVVDLAGVPTASAERPLDLADPGHAIPEMAALVGELLVKGATPRRRVWGIGVAIPGPFEVDWPAAHSPTVLPGWADFPAATELAQRLRLPVLVENDATAAAVGERLYGVARELRHFFYVYIGTGLGGGLFLDGQPYKGAWGNAGEFGHIVVERQGRPCHCGNRGCLERYLSLHAAYEACRAAGLAVDTPADLEASYRAGALAPRRWLEGAAQHLRLALNTIENLLDPEAIVIGGPLPGLLIEQLVERLGPLAGSVSARRDRQRPRLLVAAAGKDSAALGAAALPIFEAMSPRLAVMLKRPAAGRLAAGGWAG